MVRWMLSGLLLFSGTAMAAGPWTVEASTYDQATALPVHRLGLPVHPGLEVGLGLPLRVPGPTRVDARVDLGGYHHGKLANALTLDVGLGIEHGFGFGGVLAAQAGIGGMGSLATRQTLLPSPDGGYHLGVGPPRLALRPHVVVGLGWRLGEDVVRAPVLLLRYRVWLETPFAPDFIPLMTHTDLGLTLRLRLPERSRE